MGKKGLAGQGRSAVTRSQSFPLHSECIHAASPGLPGPPWGAPCLPLNLLFHAYPHCSVHSHHFHLLYFIPLLQPSRFIVLLDLHMADTFLNFRSNTTSSERPSLTTLSSSLLYLFFNNSFLTCLLSIFPHQHIWFMRAGFFLLLFTLLLPVTGT